MRRFYKEVIVLASPLEGEAASRSDAVGGKRGRAHPPPDPTSLRFAGSTSPSRGEANSYFILLDGKPIKTPMRKTQALPTRGLAEAVAEEWRGQGDKIVPPTMPLTKLANTAIDRVTRREAEIAEQVLAYANDLLCYRAEAPDDLVARQNESWNPLLDWAAERYAPLTVGTGVGYIAQPEESVEALRNGLAGRDAFVLTALHASATLCGSLVLALALADGRLDAEEAFALSQLDERYQAEKWGADEEAQKRAQALAAELAAAARFIRLARG